MVELGSQDWLSLHSRNSGLASNKFLANNNKINTYSRSNVSVTVFIISQLTNIKIRLKGDHYVLLLDHHPHHLVLVLLRLDFVSLDLVPWFFHRGYGKEVAGSVPPKKKREK